MADISAALVTYLNANAAIATLVGTRIYAGHLPEDRVLPALTYGCLGIPRLHVARYARPSFRVTAWSYTHAASWEVAEAVRLALECFHGEMGTVHAFSIVDNSYAGRYEPNPNPTSDGLCPVHVYARVWFQEACKRKVPKHWWGQAARDTAKHYLGWVQVFESRPRA